jgi:hypothetical protein
MIAKDSARAIECTATVAAIPIAPSSGSIQRARIGSPTKPSPMLAIVMPSWVAAIASSRLWIACFADRAPRRPSATHRSIWVLRTATSANSVATK